MSDEARTTPVIVSSVRTPIGRFLGGLAKLKAPELGAIVIKEAVSRAGIEPGAVQDVIIGNVLQGGVGQAPARQAAIGAGIPATVPAVTINKVCGSGLKAVMLAAQAIKAGDVEVVVAGGQESMSNAPYYLFGYRDGVKFGNQGMVDGLIHDGLWCGFYGCHMGGHAEYTAMKADISRADQDEFAYGSHMKAIAAMEGGKFDTELVKVEVPGRKGQVTVVEKDENPRADTTIESLSKLKPAFGASAPEEVKEYSVTAGNASALNDGAAALLVTSQRYAEETGLEIMARIRNYSVGATEPKDLFFAPIDAVQKLMEKDGTKIGDYDLIEANEAFAVQALADGRALGWDWDRVNVHGGAVALGHPIGASGARILVTLLGAMQDRNANLGLATLCLGGGNAVALSVERV
ncbi:MAG: acetyl-CoA C-acetyltransferase [Gemmatimonadetes bacterium]|uniref:Acetyl-CoA C-acetyltransferase n=1 Tax=Candidatus Kutchimonas denitrificans TaxID=3056748 RepID=A0AAE4ZCB5_9BACT|nr:acetyl-CoA C-acetyltransferase [Gemmatimonadota bacterium]NIR76581.1 acetyl-CoA C-acetyltransferase [Candidatus Kutchimonas denitrificans]NIS01137.1 acetyl-CoA C-acetyltransferase [Gemmatimonadota bacterium]NIT66904.1 acetyl-CoA C-acetyltransferase [Gemmatimonadota bacterium]NIU54677.1 acetyl-CoA C-acyltransferase [Gemmatimonadota bacterium]